MPPVSPEETQPTPAPASKFSIQNPTIRKIIGAILILIGLLALVTPLTPGAWLGLIGLEMLGIRLVFMKPFKVWLQKKGWWR